MSRWRKKQRPKCPPFVMLEKGMLKSEEWKNLSKPTKLIYIYLKAKYNGRNPEELKLTYIELKDEFAPATISKAFRELEEKGWVEKTKYGGLFRYYNLYKLIGNWGRLY